MQPNVRERCSKMLFPVAESGYFCDAVKIEYRGPDQNGIFWTKARKTFWLFRAFKTGPAYLRFDLNWCLHLLPITRKTTNVSMIKDYSFNIEQRAYNVKQYWQWTWKQLSKVRLKTYFIVLIFARIIRVDLVILEFSRKNLWMLFSNK